MLPKLHLEATLPRKGEQETLNLGTEVSGCTKNARMTQKYRGLVVIKAFCHATSKAVRRFLRSDCGAFCWPLGYHA